MAMATTQAPPASKPNHIAETPLLQSQGRRSVPDEKACSQCGEVKPLGEFYVRAKSPDGRTAACKPCIRERMARYRRERPDVYAYDRHERVDEWELLTAVDDIAHRLMSQVEITDGCWLWTGTIDGDGYGQFTCRTRHYRPHRLLWMVFNRQPIDDGLVADHLCRQRSCVRPDHLRIVTPQVNAVENSVSPVAENASKTHCSHGHAFTDANTLRDPETGHRTCRTCRRQWERDYRDRQRGGPPAPARKLDWPTVEEIRERYVSEGDSSQADLADDYGVSQSLISQIVRRQIWVRDDLEEEEAA